jgi:hypothetical protein
MAYVVSPRRHLAPTMGQIDMLGGVFIRTGSVIAASGVRVVSVLVQRLGSLSFISGNARCLSGRPFPRDGRIVSFGSHEVYVGTERVCRKKELVASDPLSHLLAHTRRSDRPVESAEVMMAGTSMPPAKQQQRILPRSRRRPRGRRVLRWSVQRTWSALPACRLGAKCFSPSSIGFLSRCDPAMIRSRRRKF